MKFFLNIIISILILNCNSNTDPKIQISTGVKSNKGSFEKVLNLTVKTSIEDFDISYYLNNKQINQTHKFLETEIHKTRLLPDSLESIPYYSNEFFKDTEVDELDDAIADIQETYENNDTKYQFYKFEE